MSQPDDKRPLGPLEEHYKKLSMVREPFLHRARECSKYTIPTLIPPEGDIAGSKLPTPYQSVGSSGVNNLASKLLLALYPPNGRFFRLTASEYDLLREVEAEANRIAEEQGVDPEQVLEAITKQISGEVQANLSKIEVAVVQHYESLQNRATDFEIFKHLVVAGNVLRYCAINKGDLPRYFRLDQYVTKRDPSGKVLEIIVREGVSVASLPLEIQQACDIVPKDGEDRYKEYDLYTGIIRDEQRKCWIEYQELNGKEIPGSQGKWKLDKCPWLALRWSKVDGEDYGRGHVEEYLGDLISLDLLRKAIVDGSTAAARILVMVAPNGMTRAQDVAEAENGDVITGEVNDVNFLQCGKHYDFRTAAETIDALSRSLGQAFLLTTSIQRNGERVTAAEFQRLAYELEARLGGNFATLSQEYQLPLTEITIYSLQKQRRLPKLPKFVKPTILTGVQALGRNNDLERIMTAFDCVMRIPASSDEAILRINHSEAYTRIFASQDVDTNNLIRSDEEVQQMRQAQQQQAQQAQLVQSVAPQIVNAMSSGAAAEPQPQQEM